MEAILTIDEFTKRTLISWPVEADHLIKKYLNPSFEERVNRLATIHGTMVNGLVEKLEQCGISFRIPKSDVELRNRQQLWDDRLRDGCAVFTDSEIRKTLENRNLELRSVQTEGLIKCLRGHITLLSAICGSGKTLTMFVALQFLKWKYEGKMKAIIVAKNTITSEYKKELLKFGSYLDLTIDDLSGESDFEVQRRLEFPQEDILVLPLSKIHKFSKEIKTTFQRNDGENVLIIDEGHAIKNVSSRVSRSVQYVAPYSDRVIISSATPLPLGPKDIRGYLSTVTTPMPEGFYKNSIPDEDYSLLSEITFVSSESDLSYGEVEKVKVTYDSDEDLASIMKKEVMKELDAGKKAVIFCCTNNSMESIYRTFDGVGRTVLSGSFSVEDCKNEILMCERSPELQQKAIRQFNHDPRCKILIANYRVGSTGLNLQHSGARLAFFAEITTNGAELFQSEYRIRRPYIFPEGGFRYVYAIPNDIKGKRRASRQFIKLENQQAVLDDIKLQTLRRNK